MKRTHLTKPWVTTVFCLVLFVGFIVTWLTVGEINLAREQWLIADGGTCWGGVVTHGNQDWIFNTYKDIIHQWPDTEKIIDGLSLYNWVAAIPEWNMGLTIISTNIMFNPLILIPIFCIFALGMIIPIIFRVFRWMEIDVLPFSTTLSVVSIIFMFTGLIPHNSMGDWLWVVRIVIIIVTSVIVFFFTNIIINKVIATTMGDQAISDIYQMAGENLSTRKSLKDLTDQYKKQDTMEYVEQEVDEKK